MSRNSSFRQLGVALAFAHLTVAVGLMLVVASSYRGEGWHGFAARGVLFLLDLPLSVVGWFLVLWLVPDISVRALPFPVSDLQGFLAPGVLHCVAGTVFYYFLPSIFGRSARVDEAA